MKTFQSVLLAILLALAASYAFCAESATQTEKLKIKLVDPYQGLKDITINENSWKLDAIVQSAVVGSVTDVTTAQAKFGAIADGSMFLIIATAEGIWSGKENQLAYYLNGGWSFFRPQDGWVIYNQNDLWFRRYYRIIDSWILMFRSTTAVTHFSNDVWVNYDSSDPFSNYVIWLESHPAGGGRIHIQDDNDSNNTRITGIYGEHNYFGAPTIFGTSTTIDPSAVLQVDSTDKGVLPPRLTTTQRDAIGSPAEGLFIYNTTTKKINYYNGTAWKEAAETP